MVYPVSPFTNELNTATITNLNAANHSVDTSATYNLDSLLSWLCRGPKITSIRVNTLKYDVELVRILIKIALEELARNRGKKCIPNMFKHATLKDVILVESHPEAEMDLSLQEKEIIVDAACGSAVLRGAHVFAPGVMGMLAGAELGDIVSVYADISKNCKRGLPRIYECPEKVFVGNGIIRMVRKEIFNSDIKPSGVAVEITYNVSGCPTLDEHWCPVGAMLLQNIPSIVCGHVLSPAPGEVVLDMCAAPGNKTTHLAALMENTGVLIALDKSSNKLKRLKQRSKEFGLSSTSAFECDATKCCDQTLPALDASSLLSHGPPFPAETFDKILLDAPCSGLGNRPQLLNTITDKVVRSYVPLQRKLFRNAVTLLKRGGHLVYSTCTVTLDENEGMVAWALETFNCLVLTLATPKLGGHGWPGTKLTADQLQMLQRFGPDDSVDSIGFFIAHFTKKNV
ncbi:uncharacterized protein CBL_09846 [Carabus blaptoides fortunei]